MKLALLSDIHGNLPSLEIAITQIKIKNLIFKNPRFNIKGTKFFKNVNLKQPRLENILNEI
jgi:hypothetical protein|tara:strand:- start:253 stop:435 length:183 start_codon:yes stop_codon:yes gene_type:complete